MAEDKLRELEKAKKERNDAFLKMRGVLQGLRTGDLSQDQEAYVQLLDFMVLGFKNQWTVIEDLYENLVLSAKLEGRQEARIDKLEEEVRTLKHTIDTLYDSK